MKQFCKLYVLNVFISHRIFVKGSCKCITCLVVLLISNPCSILYLYMSDGSFEQINSILYTSIISPLNLGYLNVGKCNCLSVSSYEHFLNFLIYLVALIWTFSIYSINFVWWWALAEFAYSTWGFTRALYNWIKPLSVHIPSKFLLNKLILL